MRPTVLLYRVEETKRNTVAAVCARLDIRIRSVAPEAYGQPLEAVLGFSQLVLSPEEGDVAE